MAQFPGVERVVRPGEDTVLRLLTLDLQEWRTALNSRGSWSSGMLTILPEGDSNRRSLQGTIVSPRQPSPTSLISSKETKHTVKMDK